jgi:hypothetical protein
MRERTVIGLIRSLAAASSIVIHSLSMLICILTFCIGLAGNAMSVYHIPHNFNDAMTIFVDLNPLPSPVVVLVMGHMTQNTGQPLGHMTQNMANGVSGGGLSLRGHRNDTDRSCRVVR